MKDLFNREIQVGNFIAYALTAGRSANLAIYEVKEVFPNKVKAHKIEESYGSHGSYIHSGFNMPFHHLRYVYDEKAGTGEFEKLTPEEIKAVDEKLASKVTTISMSKRAFILDNFTPEVLKGVQE